MLLPKNAVSKIRVRLSNRYRSWVALLAVVLFYGCASAESTPRLVQPVIIPFEDPLNLIVVEVSIGGEGPFKFFMDSGATGTVVDTELAQRLGLETTSAYTRRGTSINSRVTASSVQGGVDFTLAPGFEVHVDPVIVAPFTHTAQVLVGEHFDGILGSATFFQFVVEVDYEGQKVIFHDSKTYRYDGAGAILDLHFPESTPRLPAIFGTLVNGDRRYAEFPIYVDSGGQTMGTASVAKRREWDRLIGPKGRVVEALGATGLSNDPKGVTHEAFISQMDRFIMGPYEFDNPVVSYSEGGAPFAAMGASLLFRFNAVFDYQRRRLILEPNANFDDPFMVDQSGMMLAMSALEEGAFEVFFVAEGTPAQQAGIARGDVILTIDGVDTREIPLNDARALFSRSQTFHLAVAREGREVETEMTTRSLFEDPESAAE